MLLLRHYSTTQQGVLPSGRWQESHNKVIKHCKCHRKLPLAHENRGRLRWKAPPSWRYHPGLHTTLLDHGGSPRASGASPAPLTPPRPSHWCSSLIEVLLQMALASLDYQGPGATAPQLPDSPTCTCTQSGNTCTQSGNSCTCTCTELPLCMHVLLQMPRAILQVATLCACGPRHFNVYLRNAPAK